MLFHFMVTVFQLLQMKKFNITRNSHLLTENKDYQFSKQTSSTGVVRCSDIFFTFGFSKDCCRRIWFSDSMSKNFSSSLSIWKKTVKNNADDGVGGTTNGELNHKNKPLHGSLQLDYLWFCIHGLLQPFFTNFVCLFIPFFCFIYFLFQWAH